MNEISILVDESGGQNGTSKYVLMTLILHNQSNSIQEIVTKYEAALASKGLEDIPFHASPLINGKHAYAHLDHETRHKMFSAFFILTSRLPFSYKTFAYRRSELSDVESFTAKLRRDIVVFLVDNLEHFQSYDRVKIYYDNGQHMIKEALHGAIEFALSKEAVLYKDVSPTDYRLLQVADFLCTVELAAIKYDNHEETASDIKMFGNARSFRRNYLRVLRRKMLL